MCTRNDFRLQIHFPRLSPHIVVHRRLLRRPPQPPLPLLPTSKPDSASHAVAMQASHVQTGRQADRQEAINCVMLPLLLNVRAKGTKAAETGERSR